MTTLSINLNLPLPSSKSKLEKNISSSNFNLAHIGRNSSVLRFVAIRPNSNPRLNNFARFGDPLASSNSKSKLRSLSSDSQTVDLGSPVSPVSPVASFDAQLVNSESRRPFLSDSHPVPESPVSSKLFGSLDEQLAGVFSDPQLIVPSSFDVQSAVFPVVLSIADFSVKNKYLDHYDHLLWHNKLMLQTQHCLKFDHSLIATTNDPEPDHQTFLWKEHPNLYRHSFCFVGHGSYLLAGCCNNLILVCFYYDEHGVCGPPHEALWNLSTNQLKFLPQPLLPPASRQSYGFGFDPVSQDYKVLKFLQFDDDDSFGSKHIELYSLKTDSWKQIANTSGNVKPFAKPSVHTNGFSYWKAISEDKEVDDMLWPYSFEVDPIILSFDYANEKFSHIPEPLVYREVKNGLPGDYDLVEFDSSLAAIVYWKHVDSFAFEIWVWSGTEWTPRVPALEVHVSGVSVYFVVGLFENEKLFLQTNTNELLLFDCATRELENLGIHADPKRLWVMV